MSLYMPWILLGIVSLVVLGLGILVFAVKRKDKRAAKTDYRAFFFMGMVWIVMGFPFVIFYNVAFNGLLALGIIFFIAGLANRDKWEEKEPFTKNQKIAWVLVFAFAIALGAFLALVKLGFIPL
jgi:mannose/fructose/N-acetylgalactosamine-specific phosphotransferase system component IIC